MAKHLKILHKCFIMAGGLVWAAAGYGADLIGDPTRPPAAASVATVSGVAAAVDTGPVLQSVMISHKRKTALISGQEVALGEMAGEAKLVAVRDNEVDLRSPDGSLQTLRMYSGVTKTVIEVKKGTLYKAARAKQP